MTCNCMGPQNGEPLCPCQMAMARAHLAKEKFIPVAPLDIKDWKPGETYRWIGDTKVYRSYEDYVDG